MALHRTPIEPAPWPPGSGEISERIRAFDWSRTPLGPIESWSPALRMMTRFLLANRFPLLLWWGPQYVSIYNDAYRPVLGTKHPWALGQPVSECWKEIWHILKPLIDTPFNGGPATWDNDICLEINRYGFVEETHFTIAYSPVPDENARNGIGGVLATVHEITEKVVGERRAMALRDLGAVAAEAKTAEEACRLAARTLAAHEKDIPFALLYLIDADGRRAWLAGSTGIHTDGHACSPVLDLDLGEAQPWPLADVVRTKAMAVADDLAGRFSQAVPPGPWSDPPREAVVLPIRSNIAHQLSGVLVAGVSARLKLDELYRSFLELVASQIATAVANARAYEQERKRAEALAEIDRAKTLFFSNVSHEFRTPLTLILGPVEDLLGRSFTELSPFSKSQLEIVHSNSLRLLKLVNTMLDFSRIEAGRMRANYEETDLAAYTAELASNFRSACERAGLSLKIECPPPPSGAAPAFVDRDMWEKIVLNLLSNAFKFTLVGRISVSLTAIGDMADFVVQDTGVGIPAEELPRIFERFHRVNGSRGRTQEGSGIGLALVRELVRLHGGTVRVESELGGGSAFTVSIPLDKTHLDPSHISTSREHLVPTRTGANAFVEEALRWLPGSAAIERQDLALQVLTASARGSAIGDRTADDQPRPRVLWADDNADMRDYVARLLSERFEVEVAADGQAALEKAQVMSTAGRPPDLVLSDVMMPRLDGFGLMRELRANSALGSIPIILLSARAGEEARIDGMEAGADDYLIKPFSARELLARVEAQIRMAAFRRETDRVVRESEERLRLFIEHAPAAIAMFDPEMRYLAASRRWISDYRLDSELAGRSHYDIFPEIPERWKEAHRRAIAGEALHSAGDWFERTDGSGQWLKWDLLPWRTTTGEVGGIIIATEDITARKQAEAELERMQRLLAEGERVAHLGSWEYIAATGEMIWSDEEKRIYGLDPGGPTPVYGEMLRRHTHPDDASKLDHDFHDAFEKRAVFENESRIVRSDGSISWIYNRAQPYFDAAGTLTKYIGATIDITERKRHEEHVQLLMREVNHRSKNLLGLILSIARRTASTDAEDFIRRFSERIQSLAAAQDLLVKHEWRAVPLADLVRSQLSHFGDLIGGRICIAGPALSITAAASQALGMALHELATNAAKYGALSRESGRLAIIWSVQAEGPEAQFDLSWEEQGGPRVATPQWRGFGSTVTSSMVKMSVGGQVSIDYAPNGLQWRLTCPAGNIQADPLAKRIVDNPVMSPPHKDQTSASGRVLVVEDEALIASEIESMLSNAGFNVVGPAASVNQALALLEHEGCDAAILDVSLSDDETSEPIARGLIRNGTPFVVMSGYSRDQLPEVFRAAPFIAKPLPLALLEAELKRCLGASESRT
jgi:PAS domain S-box-containing protein